MYAMPGLVAMAYRLFSTWTARPRPPPALLPYDQRCEQGKPKLRRKAPLIVALLCVLLGVYILPPYPWRRLTATILYDFGAAISSIILGHHVKVADSPTARLGSNPLGNFHYDPAEDPYYISNLDEPIDEFIASALNGTHFTNIFHIVLESMREDSYPWDESGLLHQHIIKNVEFAENGTPIRTDTISPFITSLAEHTISWHTTWASIPFTHKAMLGRTPFLLTH